MIADDDFHIDPQTILFEAEQETPRRALDDYRSAIRLLKDNKQFTFREIAEWFSARGMEVDHNAVYRAYAKGLAPHEAEQAAEADDEIELHEAWEEDMALGHETTVVSHPASQSAENEPSVSHVTERKPAAKKPAKNKKPRKK